MNFYEKWVLGRGRITELERQKRALCDTCQSLHDNQVLTAEVERLTHWRHLTECHSPYVAAIAEFQARSEQFAEKLEKAEAGIKELEDERLIIANNVAEILKIFSSGQSKFEQDKFKLLLDAMKKIAKRGYECPYSIAEQAIKDIT